MLKPLFWILSIIIIYTYLGYPFLLLLLYGFKRIFVKIIKSVELTGDLPEVTLLIAAFNEKEVVESKMQNTLALNYPPEKLRVTWVTDGSDDGTPELLTTYTGIHILHQPDRKGKTAALNRAMELIDTPFVVFSDANTMLDRNAIKELLAGFTDDKVGCVAGEKRIVRNSIDSAAGSGESAYWQYEAYIKRLESGFYSALAAAGELYAIRTKLYIKAESDSIIDDFVISIKIALTGYRIRYAPDAFAYESPSLNMKEELKRKIRIASGGIQTVFRFPSLFNFFRHGLLSFEFISHKVLRWMAVPFAIPTIFILNLYICFWENWQEPLFPILLCLQVLFYLFVIAGSLFEKRVIRFPIIFLPYYIILTNYAQIAGIFKFIRRKHSVVWDKAVRA
jgi:cellulose synthase/poly-beta-1,6-N-acetylglucosamine synthase-like glycosyltransferase